MVESKHVPATSHQFHVASSCMTVLGSHFHENWSMIPKGSPVTVWCLRTQHQAWQSIRFPNWIRSDIRYQWLSMHAQPLDEDEGCHCSLTGLPRCQQKKQNGEPSWATVLPPRLVLPTNLDLVHSKAGGPCGPPTQIQFGAEKATCYNCTELNSRNLQSFCLFNQKFNGHSPLHTWIGRKTKCRGNGSWLQHEETCERALITNSSICRRLPFSIFWWLQFPAISFPSILALPFLHHDVVGSRRQGHHNVNQPLSTLHGTRNQAGCLGHAHREH